MPNWCDNYLEITAEPRVISALLAKAKGKRSPYDDTVCDFSYLPFLQEQIDACENYEANWYGFNLAKLGCKWFPEIVPYAIDITADRVTAAFQSPWGPPIAGTSAIADWLRSQDFAFTLTLSYHESGCAFCGVFTADQDGEDDLCGEYLELDAEELRAGNAEDYAAVCKSFGISFPDLQARATDDVDYVTLCPDFYQPYL